MVLYYGFAKHLPKSTVIMLPGCEHIGAYSIIGGGGTQDVPDYAIVGGNPAKIIRMRK